MAYATVLRGWAIAEQGRNEEGIAQIQEGLAASRATGAELLRPYFLCLLAEACMETGRLDDGLGASTEGLAAADEHENRSCEAETHRLKGELLLRQNHSFALRRIGTERKLDLNHERSKSTTVAGWKSDARITVRD